MRYAKSVRPVVAAMLIVSGSAFAAPPAKAPTVAVTGLVERGQWQLRELGNAGAPPRSLCITDPDALLQLEHGNAQCTRFIVDDSPRSATVHYTCPGAGNGRTILRVENDHIFHLETQGIVDGAPFDMAFEGRRSGACAGAAVR